MPILQFTMPTRRSKIKVNKGMSGLLKGGQSVTNTYLRFSGCEEEREVLGRLNKRLYHTSNEDVSLIMNNRKKKLNKIRKNFREPKYHSMKVFDNYQEIMVF
jgi:hypothetical protein